MRRDIALLLVTLPLAAGCGGGGPGQPAPPAPMPPPVLLYSDNRGGIRDSTRLVLTSEATFDRYWDRATSAQSVPPPVPNVDFERDMVIVVAMGPATPEEEIHVDSLLVRRELNVEGDRVETLSIVVRTVQGCGRFRTEAFPLEIVRARRFDGPIRWDERRQQIACDGASDALSSVPPSPDTSPSAIRGSAR